MLLEQESRVSDPHPFHADPDPGFVKIPLRIQCLIFFKNLCFYSKKVKKECWIRIKTLYGYRDTINVDLMRNRIRNTARRNTASICFFPSIRLFEYRMWLIFPFGGYSYDSGFCKSSRQSARSLNGLTLNPHRLDLNGSATGRPPFPSFLHPRRRIHSEKNIVNTRGVSQNLFF